MSATGSTAGVRSRPHTWGTGAVAREDQSRTRAQPTPGVRTTCLWSAIHANCQGRCANVERGLFCGSEEGLLKLRVKEGHRKPSSTSPGNAPQEALPRKCSPGSAPQEVLPRKCSPGSAPQEVLPRKCSTHSSHFRA